MNKLHEFLKRVLAAAKECKKVAERGQKNATVHTPESLDIPAETKHALSEFGLLETHLGELLTLAESGENLLTEELTLYAQSVIEDAVKENKIVRSEDHTALLAQAEAKGKADAEAAQQEAEQQRALAQERRTAAVAQVGDVAASALSDEQLLADDHNQRITALAQRVESMKGLNIVADNEKTKPLFVALCQVSDEDFATRLDQFKVYAEAAKVPVMKTKTPMASLQAPPVTQPGVAELKVVAL